MSYNQVVPRHVEGSLDDPSIRQLLMMASENGSTPAVRNNSIEMLADECRAATVASPPAFATRCWWPCAMTTAPRCGRKLSKALSRMWRKMSASATLFSNRFLNDNDPGVRSAAISLLEPVEADTSVRQVLYSVSNSDQNPQIRNDSRAVLSRVSEIQ